MVDLIKNNTTKIVSFVLGFLVAFAIAGYYQKSKKENAQADLINKAIEENQETASSAENTVAKLQESQESIFAVAATSSEESMPYDFIKVSDQKAGDRVDVAYVRADFPVWIVVHMEKEGKIWNALGARLKEEGQWTGVEVPLLASTVSGARYWVALYKDDGDRQFDLKKDFPLKDEEGNFILMPFRVVK